MTRVDACVIGGGPAGAALALQLARAHREVRLLERDARITDKVCGEFLSFEAVDYLRRLGLDPRALGAVALHALRLVPGHQLRAKQVEIELPFAAWSLSRRVLDAALLSQAEQAGAQVMRGANVSEMERDDLGFRVKGGGHVHRARELFLATGKHDLRGQRRAGQQDDLIGFKLHYRLAPDQTDALRGAIELVTFPGGYAGLQPVEAGYANLCLVIRREAFRELGQAWPQLIAWLGSQSEHLSRRLGGAEPRWSRPLALGHIPYGFLARTTDANLWRLGDQAAVIPSFAGDGIAIALHSAHLAASHHLKGADAPSYQRSLHDQLTRQVRGATCLSRLLVHPSAQAALVVLSRFMPQVLRMLALDTRIAAPALQAVAQPGLA